MYEVSFWESTLLTSTVFILLHLQSTLSHRQTWLGNNSHLCANTISRHLQATDRTFFNKMLISPEKFLKEFILLHLQIGILLTCRKYLDDCTISLREVWTIAHLHDRTISLREVWFIKHLHDRIISLRGVWMCFMVQISRSEIVRSSKCFMVQTSLSEMVRSWKCFMVHVSLSEMMRSSKCFFN
jgi:hypothetical protein